MIPGWITLTISSDATPMPATIVRRGDRARHQRRDLAQQVLAGVERRRRARCSARTVSPPARCWMMSVGHQHRDLARRQPLAQRLERRRRPAGRRASRSTTCCSSPPAGSASRARPADRAAPARARPTRRWTARARGRAAGRRTPRGACRAATRPAARGDDRGDQRDDRAGHGRQQHREQHRDRECADRTSRMKSPGAHARPGAVEPARRAGARSACGARARRARCSRRSRDPLVVAHPPARPPAPRFCAEPRSSVTHAQERHDQRPASSSSAAPSDGHRSAALSTGLRGGRELGRRLLAVQEQPARSSAGGSAKCRMRPLTLRSGAIGSDSKRRHRGEAERSRRCDATTATSETRRLPSAKRSICTITSIAELIWSRSASNGIVQLAHRGQRLEPVDRVVAAVGVHGHQRALVAGVERLEHVERLGAADLADDDPVGAHAQRVAHEVADRHLALALDVGRPRLERDHVRLLEPQLGVVLDGDDPLAGRDARTSAFSSVVLPAPVPPEMTMFSRARTQARSRPPVGWSSERMRDQLGRA